MNTLIKALSATLLFVVVLLVVYWLHMRFLRVNVVFYASILDAVVAAALTAGVLAVFGAFKTFTGLEKAQLLAIWLLGGYIFAISVPTVIDRSLSFYILEKIQQRGGGIRQDAFDQVFTQEYVREHHLMDIRLTEQLQSGTILIENGCVKLTRRGEELASFSRFYRRNLLPTHRLLMGAYTDALTDPFRDSHMTNDYRCK